MRRLAFIMLLLALASAYGAAKEETLAELKSRFESARPEDRPEIGIRIAQHQLRNTDKLYGEGNANQARAAVDDIVTYSEKAEKLRDIKRTLAFEDQPPVEQAVRRLEDIRTTLLKEMFAKDDKKEKK
jgi:hypothetical protein